MRKLMVCGLCVAVFSTLAFAAPGTSRAEEKFTPLFDGSKSLSGWKGDAELWSTADGAIVGSTENKTIKHNTFLISDKKYANFVLRLKFKLRNGNSGVQIRSEAHDDFVVKGYQADIADKRYMGILYEEGKRGILVDVSDPAEVAKHVKADDWNEYVITADGNHLVQTLNGYTTVDYTEKDAAGAKSGVIALQLHVGPPMRVEFKDIEIRELP